VLHWSPAHLKQRGHLEGNHHIIDALLQPSCAWRKAARQLCVHRISTSQHITQSLDTAVRPAVPYIAPSTTKMPVLQYFALRGRGEVIRLAMAYKGIELEEQAVDYKAMKTDAAAYPFAQCPRCALATCSGVASLSRIL
jgi:hypothetical protein